MRNAFQSYGKYYEIIYADKDYEKECDFLEEIFREYLKRLPKSILDVGCGAGGHAIQLAKRGYEVVGIDASEIMIDIAKKSTSQSEYKMEFYHMDVQELRLKKSFDACICMFAVIDYLVQNKAVHLALSNIRRHLKQGAPFIFDFWYGPAVLTIRPSARLKTMEKGDIRVHRFADPYLDTLRHVCRVNYDLLVTKRGSIVEEVKEEHVVRFFFPEEIRHYLEGCGFELMKLCSFPNLSEEPSERTWNVAAISRAV